MIRFKEKIAELKAQGYADAPATARLAHDVVLKAMETCGFGRNATIKGGVVMSNITGDVRRATMDMDIDFMKYSLADDKIDEFIARLNCLDGISISRRGRIVTLRQQHYQGKRIYLRIVDSESVTIETKIDIGVHTYEEMRQPTTRFDVVVAVDGANICANTKEQILVEKLKSLLRFGTRSSRIKDVYDIYYLLPTIDKRRLHRFIALLIFGDPKMYEHDYEAVSARLKNIFSSRTYLARLSNRTGNWLEAEPGKVVAEIVKFIDNLTPQKSKMKTS